MFNKYYKCAKCKFPIETNMSEIPKKNKLGETLLYKNGKVKTIKYHSKCYDDICQWNNLRKYLEDNYFSVKLPKEFIIKLRQLNKNVLFKDIHGCFEHIETDIKAYISNHKFNDDIHKSNYLMYQLNRNINTFVENKVNECSEIIDYITDFPLILDNVKSNYKQSENYEILD